MNTLASRRCLNHPAREAAARCPRCRRSYCRECVTEHDGRLLCAACLRATVDPAPRRRFRIGWILAPVHVAIGLFVAWTLFELIGLVLLRTPSAWHDGITAGSTLGR